MVSAQTQLNTLIAMIAGLMIAAIPVTVTFAQGYNNSYGAYVPPQQQTHTGYHQGYYQNQYQNYYQNQYQNQYQNYYQNQYQNYYQNQYQSYYQSQYSWPSYSYNYSWYDYSWYSYGSQWGGYYYW